MANPLAGSVKLPGIGQVPKAAVAVGVVGVGGAIWYYRTHHSSAGTAAASSGTDPYPPDGTVGDPTDLYSTDPATGTTYGDEAAGYIAPGVGASGGLGGTTGAGDPYPWDGTYNNPSDPYSMDTSTGTTYGDEGGASSGNTGQGGGPPFSTNSQWSQYVLQYFSENGYGSIPSRTDAIGKYLAGQEVDSQEEGWVNEAIAVGGPPPVAGASGYPPSIRVSGSKTGVTGKAVNPVKGLKATARTTQADLKWDAAKGATGYLVTVTRGKTTVSSTKVSGTSTTLHHLKQGTHYDVKLRAQPGGTGGTDAHVTFTTKGVIPIPVKKKK